MSEESCIEEILENFDFRKVHKAMKTLNWTWGSRPNAAVPSKKLLKEKARWLLEYAVREAKSKGSAFEIATRGFVAGGQYDNQFELFLFLRFEIASWGSTLE